MWGGVSSCNLRMLEGINSGVSLIGDLVALAPLLIRWIDDVIFLVDVVTHLSTLYFLTLRLSLYQLLTIADYTCQRLVKVHWRLLIWWLLGLAK